MQNDAGQRCNFMIVNRYLSRYSSFVLESATLVTTVTSAGKYRTWKPSRVKRKQAE